MAFGNSLLSAPAGPQIARIIAHRAAPFKSMYRIEEWQKIWGKEMVQ
jgi:hypothetical protein